MLPPPPCHTVRLRFSLPPEDLRPYVTTIYQMVIDASADDPVEDRLHPEWANLRFVIDGEFEAGIGDAPLQVAPRAVMVGPTSRACRFRSTKGHIWGVGLLPLGWLRLTDASAKAYADRFVNLVDDASFARLHGLESAFASRAGNPDQTRDRLVAALRQALGPPHAREDEIVRIEMALVDPKVHSVTQLARQAETSTRTLERFCNLAFGFSPQLLLRRQRFLRSLAQFMLDPSINWIDTLDSHYHDQAHFVRDFKRFMGMFPRAYSKLPHPVLGAAAHARKAVAGEAVQVLHRPPEPHGGNVAR